ncbi:MAG TPA: polysaccharide lyase family 8 super-sandwich domain-containing protein [Puia sp.]|nr:polysaccharide lyase family 8 super-sandwich domain-containing protein [Puia sp.]
MKRTMLLFAALYGLILAGRAQTSLSLAGEWTVKLDEQKVGERLQWYKHPFTQKIHLPGTLDDAGIGDPSPLTADRLDKQVLLHLTRRHAYIGYAWYAREVDIPRSFAGRSVGLRLERVLWATRVWVDGRAAGSRESLSTPHRYDLTAYLNPGKHLLVIRVDNSRRYDLSIMNMAHAYTNETQIIWNGILGRIELVADPPVGIASLAVYPSLKDKRLAVNAFFRGSHSQPVHGTLVARVFDGHRRLMATRQTEINLPAGDTVSTISVPIPGCGEWDEFHPRLYSVRVQFRRTGSKTSGEASARFGLRELSNNNGRLWINGRRLFLRGTLECDIFPLTGHPPMDQKGWLKVFTTAKAYGLNHLRFHSWCPPEAAFAVADSLGMYLQVELPFWNKNAGLDQRLNTFLEEEAGRISREYGNHPSFCLWSMGNELEGDFSWLNGMVRRLRSADPRHLYTSTTFTFQAGHGKWPEPGDDYYVTQYTKNGWVRGQGIFNSYPPSFATDYSKAVEGLPVPIVIHEMGQYSVYPRLAEIGKYTGVLDPLNFKAIRNDLARKDMLDLSPAFTVASGKFAASLYKEEIERALKTTGVSGFDLLDLHDFPGQGTALVGMLDAFWDSKGLVTPAQHRMYCSAIVPLIRYEKAVYRNDETFAAGVEVANFSDHALKASVPVWTATDADGDRIAGGRLTPTDIAIGNGQPLGTFSVDLAKIHKASCVTISVRLKGTPYRNQWRIWVYPQTLPAPSPNGRDSPVFDTTLDDALRHLREGRRVLLNPDTLSINGVAGRFAPVFWSPVHFPDQPGTMGILCDPHHPALADFPTERWSDWQWWDLVTSSKTMILDSLPTLHPIVRMIDNFFKNRRMGDIIEARLGTGELVLVSMDITHDLDRRPAARQLRYSLEHYMNGPAFAPKTTLNAGQLERIVSPKSETLLKTVNDRIHRAAAEVRQLIRRTPGDSFPETFDPRSDRYGMGGPSSWMSGFYPGELLYLFEATGDTTLRNEALHKLFPLQKEQYNKDTHDLGFMLYCSFGNAERVGHSDDYTKVILNSARSLAGRFNEKVGCIRSWNSDSSRFMVIIDNMMNLELLFAGTRLSGDSSFYRMAVRHALTTMNNHYRPDYSSYHLVIYDPVTGAVKKKQTVQGAGDESAWSRGQAWGLYGYTMVYRETRDPRFLEQAMHIADYLLPRLPPDGVPLWDFDAPRLAGSSPATTPRDVSAASILCSALLELSEYARGEKKGKYLSEAAHILESLMSPAYLAARGENGGFLLKHGTGNFPKHSDVDVSLIYADYYYVEALLRYKRMAAHDSILVRYNRFLHDSGAFEGSAAKPTPAPDSTGRWADIDYSDTQRANWQPPLHLQRVRAMALQWSDPASTRYHDPALWQSIVVSLDHWLKNRYRNSNWWHNQIGVPQYMRDIIVLLRDSLDTQRLTSALQVMGQYRLQHNGQGANLVWSADLGLHFGALTDNDTLIRKCARLLAGEVRITSGDGLQPDYSFHQHGARLQVYQYGAAYLQDNIRLAWQLQGTPWAYSEEKIRLLADFVLNGWQWMARGIHTVPGTIDRSVSRPDALHSADLRRFLPYLCAICPRDTAELRAMERFQNGRGTSLHGFRYFPCSDFAVYQQPRFSFFLKTISDRTLATESINGENRKGCLLNSGDAYMVETGQEYFNLMPVWDWDKLPGITAFRGATHIERRPFTGSVGDGHSGLTVMDDVLEGKEGLTLSVRKFWACHEGMVICLIGTPRDSVAGIQPYTVLDQCRWQGAFTIGFAHADTVLHEGDRRLDSVTWLRHGGVTTLFLQPTRLHVQAGPVTGSWASINTSGPARPITEKTFLPVLLQDTGATAAYILTGPVTLQEMRAWAARPPCVVLRNDQAVQAIRFADGMLMAAFYAPDTLRFDKNKTLSVDEPCLLLATSEGIFISDPSRKAKVITLGIRNEQQVIRIPMDGTSKMVPLKIAGTLPQQLPAALHAPKRSFNGRPSFRKKNLWGE